MLRRLPIPLLALLAACGASWSESDLLIYKAPLGEVDGKALSRSLLITGDGRALGVSRTAAGGLWIRAGSVPGEEWEPLYRELWVSRKLRESAVPSGDPRGLWQVFARLSRKEFSLRRHLDEPVTREVTSIRERLERTWDSLAGLDEPVDSLKTRLGSPRARVRGFAVNALLSAMKSPDVPEGARNRARDALESHLLTEGNPDLAKVLMRALKDLPR